MSDTYGLTCHDHGITGYGDPSHGVMFVGIHPGPVEMSSRKPDQGQAGLLMAECVRSGGWDPEHTYHTNLLCYDPHDIPPSPTTLTTCKNRLQDEIELYKPRLVVFFGKEPAAEFGIKKRGYINPVTYPHPHWRMYTYHPASVLHGGNEYIYDIMRDLAKIPRIMNELPPPPIQRPPFIVVSDVEEAHAALDHLSNGLILSLDIETRLHDPNSDDLDVYSNDMRCFSICDGINIYVFPRFVIDQIPSTTWQRYSDLHEWLLHNGTYDKAGLRRNGVIPNLHIAWDTCLQSYAGDEVNKLTPTFNRLGQNKLETLVGEYFGDTEYKEETKKSWRKHVEPDDQALFQRNAYDAWYTWHLKPTLDKIRPPFPAYESLLIPATNMFSEVVERGIHVDQQVIRDLRAEWGPAWLDLKLDIQEHVKNPRSWQQLSKYLYGTMEEGGLELEGGPSTAQAILKEINHPFAHSIVEFRDLSYRMEHWLLGIKKHIKYDQRLHPDVILFGPETGRRAYHNPALQTMSKHNEQQARMRALIAATNEDYVILSADYSQIEVWVGAYESEDDNLLADLNSGDVHAGTATRLGLNPIIDNDRQVGKTTNFLMQFGGGGFKLQYTLSLRGIEKSLAECNAIVDTWRNAYPKYWAWAEKNWKQIQEQGYLTTPFGRMRRCPLVTDPSWRASFINWPVQSTAGDYILTSFLELHTSLRRLDSYILFDVHDDGVYEINRKHLPEAAHLIKEVMEAPKQTPTKLMPSVKVKMTVGSNLYDQKEYKP
jgi:uracil-DNA glycosylase family 4